MLAPVEAFSSIVAFYEKRAIRERERESEEGGRELNLRIVQNAERKGGSSLGNYFELIKTSLIERGVKFESTFYLISKVCAVRLVNSCALSVVSRVARGHRERIPFVVPRRDGTKSWSDERSTGVEIDLWNRGEKYRAAGWPESRATSSAKWFLAWSCIFSLSGVETTE